MIDDMLLKYGTGWNARLAFWIGRSMALQRGNPHLMAFRIIVMEQWMNQPLHTTKTFLLNVIIVNLVFNTLMHSL